jgi:hypothetical protein
MHLMPSQQLVGIIVGIVCDCLKVCPKKILTTLQK